MKRSSLIKKLLAAIAAAVLLIGAGVAAIVMGASSGQEAPEGMAAPDRVTYVNQGDTVEAYLVYEVDN